MSDLSDLHQRYDGPIAEHLRDAALRNRQPRAEDDQVFLVDQLIKAAQLFGRSEETLMELSKARQGAINKATADMFSSEIALAERVRKTRERSLIKWRGEALKAMGA